MRDDVDELRVVAGAIVRQGRLLVALRSASMRHPGCWELPGGQVEAGETDAAALARELREELGVEVVVGALLGESHTRSGARGIHLLAYRCDLGAGDPAPLEHEAIAWATAAELAALRWAPGDVPLVDALQQELRRRVV